MTTKPTMRMLGPDNVQVGAHRHWYARHRATLQVRAGRVWVTASDCLDDHFLDKSVEVRATFDAIVEAVAQFGPVTILPEKTRIALHARMSFAAFMPRRHWLNGHLVLARRIDNPRFSKVETFSPRNVLHAFRLSSPPEVDAELIDWLGAAYEVGMQLHLGHDG